MLYCGEGFIQFNGVLLFLFPDRTKVALGYTDVVESELGEFYLFIDNVSKQR